MIHRSYDDLAADPFVAADYPALKHLFLCNEATGDTTMTDAVGGVVVSGAMSIANQGDGTITLGGAGNAMTGLWADPGTKKVLALWIGKPSPTSSLLVFGSTAANTNKGFRMSAGSTNKPAVADGTTLTTSLTASTVGDGSTLMGYALGLDWGGNMTQHDYNGSALGTVVSTSIAGMAGITMMDDAVSFNINTRPGLIAIFHVTTMPPTGWINACIAWMCDEFSATSKPLYPGLKNLA